MGIQEPIGLLTAVHFHFAGFATATIAAATLAFCGEARRAQRWLKLRGADGGGMPYVVAAGFVISPALKMGAALLFSVSVAGLAIAVRGCGTKGGGPTARVVPAGAAALYSRGWCCRELTRSPISWGAMR